MSEQRYTIEEAREIVLREVCVREEGHDLQQSVTRTMGGDGWIQVRCVRCNTDFRESA